MTPWQYIADSLRQYRTVHLAVAAGVAVATAVITGALVVGDSVRGSLRGLALQSLGQVDSVLMAEHPFREALAGEWLANPAAKATVSAAVPLLLTQGALSRQTAEEVRRAAGVQVIGAPPDFWSLGVVPSNGQELSGNQIALTRSIADELGVKQGEQVLLRLPLTSSTPADSTLGEKEETSTARRLTVSAVFSEADGDSMARFSLRPSQQAPRNVFVSLQTLQDLLRLEGKANAIALAIEPAVVERAMSEDARAQVQAALRPELVDYGIEVKSIATGASKDPEYVRISADRLVLPPHVATVARQVYGDQPQGVVTYLANAIVAGDRRVPYSTIVGVDSTKTLGPLFDDAGEPLVLADDEVVINDWTARELEVKAGDEVTVAWYEPETTHGRLREHEPLRLKIRAIVPLAGPNGQPTAAADPQLAPDLPGVTDQQSIDDWELPFELVEEISAEDEKYWDDHRTTPKAFVSHALAERLWQTRWGTESLLRLPIPLPPGERDGEGIQPGSQLPPSTNNAVEAAASVANALRDTLDPAEMGMSLLPAKQQALDAAAGTTPFDGLFLGFSFFLMASALMLVALLFRLGVEQRRREVGLLLALGMTSTRVRRILLGEAAIVSAVGAIAGALAGVGYARLMVHGLNTWWVDATAAPFLELHVTPRSIAIGFAAGLLVALATMAWSLRQFARLPAQQLLSGDAQPRRDWPPSAKRSRAFLPVACVFGAVALGAAASKLEGEAQAGAFFGGGVLVLVGLLAAVRGKLRESTSAVPQSMSLSGLAARNARRNPHRTLLTLALAATASFLIVALSAFRLSPTDSGTGGFALLGAADVPIHYDLNASEGRRELAFSPADSERLADVQFVGFRVHDGEDASCLNLYQPTQPRVLGAPPELAALSHFAWAGVANPPPSQGGARGGSTVADASQTNWAALDFNLGDDEHGHPVEPVVLDRNTAYYSLKTKLGGRFAIRDSFNREATCQVVGLLANSVLQGDLVVSQSQFLRLFPEEAGRRFFLVRRGATAPPADALAALLETQLEDFGFDAVDARQRLSELLAVQNTYLSTFQSLGALGLLLGVVGLAVAQLRSVVERRGELALMQAAGFRRRRLAAMVLAENLVLLVGGLGLGCLAALAVVLPHTLAGEVGAPWASLALLLAIVAVAGAAAAWLASRAVLRAPLLPALRGD